MVILTKSGTKYYFDTQNQLFKGGSFKTSTQFIRAEMLIGDKGRIYLPDGCIVCTSEVVKYL